jgi:hypothetical protein
VKAERTRVNKEFVFEIEEEIDDRESGDEALREKTPWLRIRRFEKMAIPCEVVMDDTPDRVP